MALFLAPLSSASGGEFVTISHSGFASQPPALRSETEAGTRVIAGHTLSLDDPLTQRRIDSREVEFWREFGIHYFIPCVSKDGTIAVMAIGRKGNTEPLSSEDMALLAAVAAQAATALENGRLYRQLRVKAEELDRMREFSENILESLNDGLAVVNRDDHVIRWNRRLEELYGLRHEEAVDRPMSEIFDQEFFETLRSARRESPEGAAIYRVAVTTRHDPPRRVLVNVATTPLRESDGAIAGSIVVIEDISARVQLEEQLQISEKMASIGLLAAGVAHEVNTPLTGISSYTQMLLQGAAPDDPKTRMLEKIERQTFRAAKIVNGLLNLARPAQVDSGPIDVNAVVNDVLSLLEHQLRNGSIQVRKELLVGPADRAGDRVQAAAGFSQPVPERTRRHAEGRVADDHYARGYRLGDGGGCRYRLGYSGGSSLADLRSVLHHEGDRPRHRPRAVDHLRHSSGAWRHDQLRQPRWQRDPFHPDSSPRCGAR